MCVIMLYGAMGHAGAADMLEDIARTCDEKRRKCVAVSHV